MSATALPVPAWSRERASPLPNMVIAVLVWLLPFHSLLIASLVGSAALPFETIRMIAAWKELAIAALLAWVMARAALGRGPGVSVSGPDMLVAGVVGVGALFLLTENPILRAGIPPGAELYGFRDTVFFMLLYFVGRGTPELADDGLMLRHLFLMALVISMIGLIERIFVTPQMLVLLGVASYVNDFLGMSAMTEGTVWGLPQNYWTIIGGVPVQRAGSVFLHSQGFALPFLLLMPVATAWVLGRGRRHPTLARLGYALLWTGLLLTITRMTIIVCAIQVVLYFLMVRKPEWSVGTVIAGLAVFGIALTFVPGLRTFVWETLTWQTGSSESHLRDWSRGLIAFLEQPWGHGLGTAEQVAVRFGLPSVSADNLYLAYATQLGVLGLVGFVGTLLMVMAKAWRVFRTAGDERHRQLGAAVTLAAVGIMLNGSTSSIFSSNLLSYLFFLLAGVVVSVWQRQASQARALERVEFGTPRLQ